MLVIEIQTIFKIVLFDSEDSITFPLTTLITAVVQASFS